MATLLNTLGQSVLVGTDDADVLDSTFSPSFVRLVGGLGNDTYIVDDSNWGVIELLDAGTDTIRIRFNDANFFTPVNIENVVVEAGFAVTQITGNELNNSLITSDPLANIIDGGLGADVMAGGNGGDTYYVDNAGDAIQELALPGSAPDIAYSSVTYTIAVNVENLTLTGLLNIDGTGNALDNYIVGNAGKNRLVGLAGNDDLTGGDGDDTLDGGDGDDDLDGGNGKDMLLGGNGADEIAGGSGDDTMVGGAGDDEYTVNDAGDVVTEAAGGGSDKIFVVAPLPSYTTPANVEQVFLPQGSGAVAVIGNALSNHILGNELDNTLRGEAGHDTLDGGAGADTMIGGAGNDTYVSDNPGDRMIESGGTAGGIDTIVSTLNVATLPVDIENVTLAGSAQFANGNDAANLIIGNGANSTLRGFGGNDRLMDGGSAALLFGGQGDDVYVVRGENDNVREFAGEGRDRIISADFGTIGLSANVEEFELKGALDEGIIGNLQDNLLIGNSGANLIDGRNGYDTMQGGLGDDEYIVDQFSAANPAFSDKVVENPNAGHDEVWAKVSYVLPANVENLHLWAAQAVGDGTGNGLANQIEGNYGNNTLSGLDGNDTLNGRAGDDMLLGGNGDDMLDGSTGIDTMDGGAGNDTMWVDNPNDVAKESAAVAGTDTVLARVTYSLNNPNAAGIENLTLLVGAGEIGGTGNALNNVLTGNESANVLNGLGGNDTIDGGLGADTMDGGAGNDTITVDEAGDVVIETLAGAAGGTDTVRSTITFNLGGTPNVENLTLLGAGDLNGTGNGLANVIIGNGGANTLDGGAGADQLRGGKGNDTYVLDAATDLATELAGEGDLDLVEVNFTPLGNLYSLAAEIEQADLGDNVGNVNVTGTAKANGLLGSLGNNTLNGGDGNDFLMGDLATDTLNGGNGDDLLLGDDWNGQDDADTLVGGFGNDWYFNDPNDTVVELANQGIDTIWPGYSVGGYDMAIKAPNVENVFLDYLSAGETLLGNGLDNIVYGNMADHGDTIQTRFGNDRIVLTDYVTGTPNDAILAYWGETLPWAATGVRLDASDQIDGGDGTDRLDAQVSGFDSAAGPGTIQGIEDVHFYSATAANTVDMAEVTGAGRVTVHNPLSVTGGPAYSVASLTLNNVANGADLGVGGFSSALTANLAMDTGADSLDLFVQGFTGTLTTPDVETLNFNMSLGTIGNSFTLGSIDPDVYAFTGSGGPVAVTGFEDGDTLKFMHHDSAFTVNNAALDQLTVFVEDSFLNLSAPGASFSSFNVQFGTNGTAAVLNLAGIAMDGGQEIVVTGDGSGVLVAAADVDASAATGNLRLVVSGATGRTVTGGENSDVIQGGDGSDVLSGGPDGFDWFFGDTEGGPVMADTFVFDHAPAGSNVALLWDFTSGTDIVRLNKTNGAFDDIVPSGGGLDAADFAVVETLDLDSSATQHVIFETSSGNLYYNPTSADASDAVVFANVDAAPITAADIDVI